MTEPNICWDYTLPYDNEKCDAIIAKYEANCLNENSLLRIGRRCDRLEELYKECKCDCQTNGGGE